MSAEDRPPPVIRFVFQTANNQEESEMPEPTVPKAPPVPEQPETGEPEREPYPNDDTPQDDEATEEVGKAKREAQEGPVDD